MSFLANLNSNQNQYNPSRYDNLFLSQGRVSPSEKDLIKDTIANLRVARKTGKPVSTTLSGLPLSVQENLIGLHNVDPSKLENNSLQQDTKGIWINLISTLWNRKIIVKTLYVNPNLKNKTLKELIDAETPPHLPIEFWIKKVIENLRERVAVLERNEVSDMINLQENLNQSVEENKRLIFENSTLNESLQLSAQAFEQINNKCKKLEKDLNKSQAFEEEIIDLKQKNKSLEEELAALRIQLSQQPSQPSGIK